MHGTSERVINERHVLHAGLQNRTGFDRKRFKNKEEKKIKGFEQEDAAQREEFFRLQNEMSTEMADAFVEKRKSMADDQRRTGAQIEDYEVELKTKDIWDITQNAVKKQKETNLGKKKKGKEKDTDFYGFYKQSAILTQSGQNANNSPEIQKINEIINILTYIENAGKTKAMSKADIDKCVADYKNLDLDTFAFSARFLDETVGDQPEEANILLYHCLMTALKDVIDRTDKSYIDMNRFGDLVGVVEALDQAANMVIQNDSFQKEARRLREAMYQTKSKSTDAADQEWVKAEDDRRSAEKDSDKEERIHDAIEHYFAKKLHVNKQGVVSWLEEDDYKDLLEKTVSNVMIQEEKQELLYFTEDILLRRIYFISARLNRRLAEVWTVVSGYQNIHHNIPAMMEWVAEKAVKENKALIAGKAKIVENDLAAVKTRFENGVAGTQSQDGLVEETDRYYQRILKIENAFGIRKDAEEDREAWEAPEIRNLLLRSAEKGK
ncbi:MAG: hypothetical protein Q4C06_08815, partial [Bacillota bacterium]|nr:hypothetical protein [Bacillota bacterium]